MRAASAIALAVERLLRPGTRLRPSAGKPVREVLILEYILPLGACVCMTPVFEGLHRQGKRVIVATRGTAFDLLRHSPFIDELIETPDPLHDLRGAVRHLRGQMEARGLRPDCVLTGSFDQRSRIAILGAAVCAGWRGGYTVAPSFYHRPLLYDPAISRIENNLRLTGLTGLATTGLQPKIFFTQRELTDARELLRPVADAGRPICIVVSQSGREHYGWWRAERWQATLAFVQEQLGFVVVYLGTATEAPAVEALRSLCGGTSQAGETTLPVLAAVLSLADLVISVDTGTMHVARATGVPMVALAPSWQPALQWMPLGLPQVRVLRGADIVLPIPDDYQLDEISAGEVCAAAMELMGLYPPDEQAREVRVKACLSD